jgi:hypothetical protein
MTPLGGTLTSADGRVSLTFPPGAVAEPTPIAITPATVPPDDRLVPGVAYHFEPSGFQFAKPVHLTIRYGPLPSNLANSRGFVWIHKWVNGQWVPVAGSPPDTVAGVVSADLTSFSNYGAVISDLVSDVHALASSLALLVGTPIASNAINLLQALSALLAKADHPLFQQLAASTVDAAYSVSCFTYKNFIQAAVDASVDDFEELEAVLGPVTVWAGVVEKFGTNACQPPVALDVVLTQKFQEFASFTLARLQQLTTTDFTKLLDEVNLILKLRKTAQDLGLADLELRLINEGQVPLLDRLRPSAYTLCRAQADHRALGELRAGMQAFDYVSYTEEQILEDIQFCATKLDWRLVDAKGAQAGSGSMGGTNAPGAPIVTASIGGVRDGVLILSGDVRSFRCDDASYASQDELIVTFGGVEVRRFTPGTGGNFFAPTKVISVAELHAAAGVDPDAAGTYQLALSRTTFSDCARPYVTAFDFPVTLATLAVAYPAPPDEPEVLDIDGSWTLVVDGVCSGIITFNQQGTSFSVTGSIGGTFCPYSTSGSGSGNLNGQAISAGIAFNGLGQVNFDGTVASDGQSMSGTYSGASGNGSWSATKN